MPANTRRQCGCNCSNQAEWEPAGDVVPTQLCSACDNNPCEYLVIFDRCDYECDGLRSTLSPGNATNPGESPGVVCLFHDGCRFEDHCRWSWKDNLTTNPPLDFDLFLAVGTKGECYYEDWTQFFGNAGSFRDTPVTGDIPVFGCVRNDDVGPLKCGWYDFDGMECSAWLEWEEWLASANTFNRWQLDITGTTATLTGTTDSGDTVEYTTTEWECPDAEADPPVRNTLTMTDYPDTIPACGKFPKSVCVIPGYTLFETPCDTVAHMQTCCDAGADEACFNVDLYDCDGVFSDTVYVTTTRNAGLPVADPSGACGYFWGTFSTACSDTMGLLVWCDGSSWNVKLYCNGTYGWSEVYSTTATLDSCCPNFRISWTPASTDFGDCCCSAGTIDTACCPDNLLPETLTGELSPDPTNPTACTGYDQSGSLTHSTTGAGPTLQHFWSGTISDCGTSYEVKITCDGTWKAKVWEPAGTCMGATTEGAATYITASSATCDPLELVFAPFDSSVGGCSCCPGSPPKAFQLTVTA